MKLDRLLPWLWLVFLALGVGLLIVGAVVLVRTLRFVADAEHATGTVTDMSRERDSEGGVTFYPVVRFTTVAGERIEFVSTSGSNPPSETPGDRVEVLYNPDDPYAAKLSGPFHVWLPPIILLGMGAVFAGSAWFVRRTIRPGPSEADIEWLRAHGNHVKGGSPRAVHDESLVVGGRSPFLVEVDVHDPVRNEVRVLTSARVWFDPAPYLEDREALDVYIDPERSERYFIDLSFLPSRAG